MDALQDILNRTSDDLAKLQLKNESKVVESLEKIKKEGTPEQYAFIKNAFDNARKGNGNPEEIMNQFKNL